MFYGHFVHMVSGDWCFIATFVKSNEAKWKMKHRSEHSKEVLKKLATFIAIKLLTSPWNVKKQKQVYIYGGLSFFHHEPQSLRSMFPFKKLYEQFLLLLLLLLYPRKLFINDVYHKSLSISDIIELCFYYCDGNLVSSTSKKHNTGWPVIKYGNPGNLTWKTTAVRVYEHSYHVRYYSP